MFLTALIISIHLNTALEKGSPMAVFFMSLKLYFLTTNNPGIILNKADIQADTIISLTELTGEQNL